MWQQSWSQNFIYLMPYLKEDQMILYQDLYYRKLICINFQYWVQLDIKRNLVRSKWICSNNTKNKEISSIKQIFIKNDYPSKFGGRNLKCKCNLKDCFQFRRYRSWISYLNDDTVAMNLKTWISKSLTHNFLFWVASYCIRKLRYYSWIVSRIN